MAMAKKAAGTRPKSTKKLETYAKQVEDYKTGKRTYAPVKPGKTGQSGYSGKVTPAVLAQVKKDGMAVALQKVATYKSPTNAYIEAAYRMYGKAKVDAVRNSPAVQKKLSTAKPGGKGPDSKLEAFIKMEKKAITNIPKIPVAAARTIKKKITGR